MRSGARPAKRRRRVVLSGLLAGLLAACSSTGDPSLDLAAPAYGDAGAPTTSLSMADAESATGQGDASAPEQVAAAPNTKPAAKPSAEADLAVYEEAVAKAETAASSQKSADKPLPVAGRGEILENGGPILTAGVMPDAPVAQKKKSFLSSFFGSTPAQAAQSESQEKAQRRLIAVTAETKAAPEKPVRTASLDSGGGDFALPGVRKTNLFEIKRKSGLDDDSDIDVHEDIDGPPVVLASAAGLARLAPNGLLKQRESVDVGCLKPALVRVLKTVERHYGKKMVVTSGYRSPTYNRKVNGAKRSQHMYCAAADVQVPGVSKWELAKYVRSMAGRGGVGTYCHTDSVHIDIGPERDWNWNCRKRRS